EHPTYRPEEPSTERPHHHTRGPVEPSTEQPEHPTYRPEEPSTEQPESPTNKPLEPITEEPAVQTAKPVDPNVPVNPNLPQTDEPKILPSEAPTPDNADVDCIAPNGTEFGLTWWQRSGSSRARFNDVSVSGTNGVQMYPIHLNEPMTFKIALKNKDDLFAHGFFRQTIRISQFVEHSRSSPCSWVEVPTHGVLDNMAACVNGFHCPVQVRKGQLTLDVDFSQHTHWLRTLRNDVPYQFEILMTDMISNQYFSFVVQSRALTK
ncbi:hypothetical protein PFISCL1PPCAC_13873, partial [Pristionchus fissidentatus]